MTHQPNHEPPLNHPPTSPATTTPTSPPMPFHQILKKAHGSLMVHEDALSRVCEHLLRVLNTLLFSFPFLAPHNIAEISERVRKRLPKTIASGCLLEATANLDTFKGSKKNTCLFLPVEKVHQLLVKVGVVVSLLLWCCCYCGVVAVVVLLLLWFCCRCGVVAVVVLLLLWCCCCRGVVAVVVFLPLWCCCRCGVVAVVVLLLFCCVAAVVLCWFFCYRCHFRCCLKVVVCCLNAVVESWRRIFWKKWKQPPP